MYLPPAGPPSLPEVPATIHHGSPYLDPTSPKYSVPGIIIFAGLAGVILLSLLIYFLWKNRVRVADSIAARAASIMAWFGSLPLPVTACLCGFIPEPAPSAARPTAPDPCPPPPYDDLPPASPAAQSPALPPGLPLPGRDSWDGLGTDPHGRRASRSRAPPPAYPPPPPPTPEPGHVTEASSAAPASPPPSPPPTYPPPPLPIASARRAAQSLFASGPSVSSPRPRYPPAYHRVSAANDLGDA